jgi:hypothetical protein
MNAVFATHRWVVQAGGAALAAPCATYSSYFLPGVCRELHTMVYIASIPAL